MSNRYVRLNHELDPTTPLNWFGVGRVLKEDPGWLLVEFATAAGTQWIERDICTFVPDPTETV